MKAAVSKWLSTGSVKNEKDCFLPNKVALKPYKYTCEVGQMYNIVYCLALSRFKVRLSATAENCLLTAWPYLAVHRTGQQIVLKTGITNNIQIPTLSHQYFKDGD